MIEDKKVLSLQIIEILREYTDENHSLTYFDIANKLEEKYKTQVSTKTISRFISALMEFGIEIIKHGNNGCSLASRFIENSELSFLIDAIFSSKSISSKHAKGLIENLMKDCSVYDRKKYDYIYKADEIVRTNNKEFFYTIDVLSRAIENKQQVAFKYNEILPNKQLKKRFNGKEFIINPYFMINNHGKYYLVCNYDKYNSLANYKIECISGIKILNTPAKPIEKLEDAKDFEIGKYVNEHIYMFHGKTIEATIEIEDPRLINDIVDWFGEDISISQGKNTTKITFNVNEQAFLYWALQYGLNIKILAPMETKEKYIEMLSKIMKKYQ